MFTAGRYEYRNKGVDMFIESLARMSILLHDVFSVKLIVLRVGLNYRLKKTNTNTTVVAFIIMPAATHSYTIDALKGQAVTKQLRDTVTEIQNKIGQRLFDHAMRSNGYGFTTFPYAFYVDHFNVVTTVHFLHRMISFLKKTRSCWSAVSSP